MNGKNCELIRVSPELVDILKKIAEQENNRGRTCSKTESTRILAHRIINVGGLRDY